MNAALLSLTCLLSLLAPKQGGPCTPSWVPTFGSPGIGGQVNALAAFDDGDGPALYVGGHFFHPDGQTIIGVMKRTGTDWSALGSGLDGEVLALATFEDQGGPALYAGGSFPNAGGQGAGGIARWNGS